MALLNGLEVIEEGPETNKIRQHGKEITVHHKKLVEHIFAEIEKKPEATCVILSKEKMLHLKPYLQVFEGEGPNPSKVILLGGRSVLLEENMVIPRQFIYKTVKDEDLNGESNG